MRLDVRKGLPGAGRCLAESAPLAPACPGGPREAGPAPTPCLLGGTPTHTAGTIPVGGRILGAVQHICPAAPAAPRCLEARGLQTWLVARGWRGGIVPDPLPLLTEN